MNKKKIITFLMLGLGVLIPMLGASELFEKSITVKMVPMQGFAKQGFLIMGSIMFGTILLIALWSLLNQMAKNEKRHIQFFYFVPFCAMWFSSIACIFLQNYYHTKQLLLCGVLIILTFSMLYRLIDIIADKIDH